jgi:hypothetical protein
MTCLLFLFSHLPTYPSLSLSLRATFPTIELSVLFRAVEFPILHDLK